MQLVFKNRRGKRKTVSIIGRIERFKKMTNNNSKAEKMRFEKLRQNKMERERERERKEGMRKIDRLTKNSINQE